VGAALTTIEETEPKVNPTAAFDPDGGAFDADGAVNADGSALADVVAGDTDGKTLVGSDGAAGGKVGTGGAVGGTKDDAVAREE
jgi:hypothetical protein